MTTNHIPSTGHIVNTGTPPVHTCSTIFAPGRPNPHQINDKTVWQCSCGKFYQMRITNVYDIDGEDYGTEPRWYRVKNAAGEDWVRTELDPTSYLTTHRFTATCTLHGRVRKTHRHYEWI